MIEFLKTFHMPFSDLKNSRYFQSYFEKTEKFMQNLEFFTQNRSYLCEKKAQVRKFIVIFKAF